MVYGAANLMGVPWETIIKMYRARLGDRAFATVEQYADSLQRFIQESRDLFPESQQIVVVEQLARQILQELEAALKEEIDDQTEDGTALSIEQIEGIALTRIKALQDICDSNDLVPSMVDLSLDYLGDRYRSLIGQVRTEVLGTFPSTAIDRAIESLVLSYVTRDVFAWDSHSGIVIAGFGSSQVFPAMDSFRIEGVVSDRAKIGRRSQFEVTFTSGSAIFPFAERSTVDNFVDGIDPGHLTLWRELLRSLGAKIADHVVGSINTHLPGTKKEGSESIRTDLLEYVKKLVSEADSSLTTRSLQFHSTPVYAALANLPKFEIAALAESLVNLSTLKRRFTLDQETVGGPIDVAVISKGDGFIWVKRKNYFDPGLNHSFFQNYYRSEKIETGGLEP